MKIFINKKILVSVALLFALLSIAKLASADDGMLPLARVFYRPDGGVSIMHFVASSCRGNESVAQCMDRISQKGEYKNLPYDDFPRSQIPSDRTYRDKWRGEKGRGIWIDHNLVTKAEKIQELQQKLEVEADKDSPEPVKVIKLQHQIEKARKINNKILTTEDLALFEEKQKSFLASAVQAVGDLFSGILEGIKNGFLALKNLVVGSPEKPSGITTYDHETGQPYCLIVRGGKVESVPGTCESLGTGINTNTQMNTNGTNTGNDTQTDTQPPVITLNGLNPAEIPVGERYSDLGATVTDNKDQNLGYKVILSSVIASSSEAIYPHELSIDTSVPAEYAITYIAVDQAGNRGTASRTVIVFDPNANSGTSEVQNIDGDNSGTSDVQTLTEPIPEPASEPIQEPSASTTTPI